MSFTLEESHPGAYSRASRASDNSCLVQQWPIKPDYSFVVKGANVDDEGVEYHVPFDYKFHQIFCDNDRLVGAKLRQVVLTHSGRLISPDSTPFDNSIKYNEVILAHEKDDRAPLAVNGRHQNASDMRMFNVQEMIRCSTTERFVEEKSFLVKALYEEWARPRGITWEEITLYLNHKSLDKYVHNLGATIDEAGIYDGVMLYGRLNYDG